MPIRPGGHSQDSEDTTGLFRILGLTFCDLAEVKLMLHAVSSVSRAHRATVKAHLREVRRGIPVEQVLLLLL